MKKWEDALASIKNGGYIEIPYDGENEKIVPLFNEFYSKYVSDRHKINLNIDQQKKIIKIKVVGAVLIEEPEPEPEAELEVVVEYDEKEDT